MPQIYRAPRPSFDASNLFAANPFVKPFDLSAGGASHRWSSLERSPALIPLPSPLNLSLPAGLASTVVRTSRNRCHRPPPTPKSSQRILLLRPLRTPSLQIPHRELLLFPFDPPSRRPKHSIGAAAPRLRHLTDPILGDSRAAGDLDLAASFARFGGFLQRFGHRFDPTHAKMEEVVFASLFSFKIFRVVDRALKKHFNFDAEETVMQLFQRPILTKVGKDLIESAKKGDLPTPFGRQNEIDDVAYILERSKRNNPCLIGERGVGKKTIVHGLAKLIADGGARKCIAGKKVIYVDLKLLDSDEKMSVNKFKRLMKEGKKRKDTILFIGEVHDLLGVGADAVKLLGQALAGNDLQCIATSTPSEFKKHKLDQYFAAMEVDEVTVDTTVQILKGLHQDFQNRLELQLSDGVFVAAATLAHRHISDGLLPQKAICLINKVGSKRSMRREADTIKEEDLRRFLKLDTVFTGHPIEEYLHKRVIGQDDGVGAVTRAVHRATLGLNDPNKPIASFVFCGTTGVGKTELAKALASFLFGSDAVCLELDITKVMHSQSFACELTDAVRWHQKVVILLKDFENANPDIENMMLKIVQHGTLTGKKGLVYDFRKSALIMTCSIAQMVVENLN